MPTNSWMLILAISGSLRGASSNTELLKTVTRAMPTSAEMRLFEGLGNLPAFNPDIEPAPESVSAFRTLIAAADAVAISTPEYAHGVPGVLKNALDWLVGSGELYRKPVVLLHRSDRGEYAQASLREILTIMGAEIVFDAVIKIPQPNEAAADSSEAPRSIDLDTAVAALIRQVAERPSSLE
jgi:chromate reductase